MEVPAKCPCASYMVKICKTPRAPYIYRIPTFGSHVRITLPDQDISRRINKNSMITGTQHSGDTSNSSRDGGLPIQDTSDLEKENPPPIVDSDSSSSPLPSTAIIWLLTACMTLSNIVMAFGNTGVTVMLDELAEDLHIAENNLQWTINSFQLPLVSEPYVESLFL